MLVTCVCVTHCQDGGLQVQVDGVHNDEDLLVLVREAVGLSQRSLAEVLNPAVLAQEGGGQTQRQTQLEGEAVYPWGQQDGTLACIRTPPGEKINGKDLEVHECASM